MTNFKNDAGGHFNKVLTLLAKLKYGDGFDETAFSVIANLERESTLQALRLTLNHPNPELRTRASEVLFRLDAKSSQELILPLLRDNDDKVRYNISELLSYFGDDRAVNSLLDVLKTDSDVNVRCSAVVALGAIGDMRVIPFLEHVANNDFEKDFQGDTVSSIAKKMIELMLNPPT